MSKKVTKKKSKKKKVQFDKKTVIFPLILIIIIAIILIIPKNKKQDIEDNDVSVDIIHGESDNDKPTDETTLGEIIETQKDSDEVKIGIAKYQEFLWMVDGAFYNPKNDNAYEINGNKSDSLSFKCEYRGTNDKCYGVNFEENYNKVFSNKVSINRVYGDGVSLRWYEKKDNEYVFRPAKNCTVEKMSSKQSLVLKEKTSKELTFTVYYKESVSDGPFQGEHSYEKEFVLVKEDGTWKVRKAYYHNPCYVEYNVE